MSRPSERREKPGRAAEDQLPAGHFDAPEKRPTQAKLGLVGWLRWFWRQLTSMRTALLLLLLLAFAAVPGSLVPQRSADPNGVLQYEKQHPVLYPILNSVQAFDTYTSVWFSAIYLLLFLSLIGCLIPRITHHVQALLAKPPKTPSRLGRMAGYTSRTVPGTADEIPGILERARRVLRSGRYRTIALDERRGGSVSAERGYLRESGNLVFHLALLGILITVGVGGGFGYTGQRVVIEGQSFVNTLVNYDSFNPGRFVNTERLSPYAVKLDKLKVGFKKEDGRMVGDPTTYLAHVTSRQADGETHRTEILVNHPLRIDGTSVYLLGNGYAPVVTVRNADGKVVFHAPVPFIAEDSNQTSGGVIKLPDGLGKQLGLVGFFYPTKHELASGAYTSSSPAMNDPMLSLQVYSGDLGLDDGIPVSVYSLDTKGLTQLAGGQSDEPAVRLAPGQTTDLPDGLGTISLDGVKRYASLEIHHDPTQGFVLFFALAALAGLLTSLFVPRRRLWVRVSETDEGLRFEYAGLARGEDPNLVAAVEGLAERHGGFAPDDPPDGGSAGGGARIPDPQARVLR